MKLIGLTLFLAIGAVEDTSNEFFEDFRGKRIEDLKIIPSYEGAGKFLKSEPEGLRLTLPARKVKYVETGVLAPFHVRDDFEITVGYEILQVDPPNAGNGVTFEVFVVTNAPTKEALAFGRYLDSEGPGLYLVGRRTTNALGQRQALAGYRGTPFVADAGKAGHLRITRIGPVAVLSAAEAGAKDFQEVFRTPLGTEDLVRVRIAVNPNGASSFVDVRLVDLRVKGTLVSIDATPLTAGDTRVANERLMEEASGPRRTYLWLSFLVAVPLLLVGLLRWRHNARARKRMQS
jgi:hypothetical protein